MVRPKKTPISSIISQRATDKKKVIDETIKEKSIDLETDSDNTNKKKNNAKNSKIQTPPTLAPTANSENENNDAIKTKSNAKKQKDQSLSEEKQSIEQNDTNSDTTKEKKSRKSVPASTKSSKSSNQINETLVDKEPRKRRLASLNAEFLVHYCSNSGNAANVTISLNSNETKKQVIKNADIVSNSSSKNDTKAKRQRVSSLDESETNRKDKKLKNEPKSQETETEEEEEEEPEEINTENMSKNVANKKKKTNTNLNNKNKSIAEDSVIENVKPKRGVIKKGKAGNMKRDSADDEDSANASESEMDSDDERDSKDDEDCSEDDSIKRNYAKHKDSKKPVRKSSAKKTIKKELETSKNSKKKQQDTENETDLDQVEEENKKNTNKKQKTVKKTRNSRSRAKTKEESTDSSGDEDLHLKKKTVEVATPQTSGRPKREAGLRASAMIIQTNEIEKTRFQYFSSATTSSVSLQQNAPSSTPNTNQKKKSTSTSSLLNQVENAPNKKSKPNEPSSLNKSHENFQVPQPISLYNSLANTLSKTNMSNRSKHTTKTRANELVSSHQFTSSQANQSSMNSRHLPLLASNSQVNCAGGDDSSSNDVQILMETSPQKNTKTNSANLSKSNVVTDRALTEDVLAEHNKLYGTLGCGSGGFNNYTREYISKWALEYKMSEDKPFPPGQIPIESFGVKILNEPQYLQSKSRSGSNNNSSNTTTNNNSTTTVPAAASTATAVASNAQANNSQTLKSKVQSNSTSQLKSGQHGPMIASSSLNDLLAASASSISLNKVISSNSAFNNLAAALNLNLATIPTNNGNNFQSASLNKKPFTPLVTAVAVAQSLQSFHHSKKISSTTPLHSTPNNSGNFSFLNSINSTSSILTQPATSEWQFSQAISKESPVVNDILTCEALNTTKNLELWNKLKNSHANLESLAKTQANETLSLLGESIAKSNPNLMQAPPLVNDSDYLRNKIKTDQTKEHTQDIINTPNMTMINVENLNFYTSIEGVHQQSHYLNHDLSCTGCMKNVNNKNCYDHYRHSISEPTSHCMDMSTSQLQDQTSLASHLNYTQATAAATAAAVAMNIAKILTVNSRNLAQTNSTSKTNDDVNETKFLNKANSNIEMSNVSIKYPHKKQHLRSAENLESANESCKSQLSLDQLSSTIKIETTINDNLKNETEKDVDSASTIKSDNSKSDLARNSSQNDLKNKLKTNKKAKKNSFIIQKDTSALSCSCRIKLEPDSMTITIDTNKDNFANEKDHICCSHKSVQHIDLKLSPGKINISKKNKSCEENQDDESDSESVASSKCSSSSGSIHLIVDEASTTNIEASDSNLSKLKTDLNESKLPTNDTTEKLFSESNFVTINDSIKDNVSSSPTSFFFNNKNSNDAETTTNKTPEPKPKKWSISSNLESDNQQSEDEKIKTIISLVDSTKKVKINIDDYVVFNSDKFVFKPKNEVKFTLFNDATNESSNTTYSIEDEEDDELKTNLKYEQENTQCYGQICSIWNEPKSDCVMLKIRALLKPEQIQTAVEKTFEKNELFLTNFYFNDFDAENLIKKCTILDKENYEKLKLQEDEESSDAFFYRCEHEYDFYKKCFSS